MFDFLFLHVAECPTCLTKAVVLFLLVMLLGLILGWILWGRFLARMKKAEQERDDYHARLTNLEKDFASLKYTHDELNREAGTFRSQIGKLEADKAVLEAQMIRLKEQHSGEDEAKPTARGGIMAGTGADKDGDDLKIIEGIGPKIDKLLKAAGINTFGDLAKASADKVREILDAAGSSFNLADPDSWAKQAKLAAAGKWDELTAYQDKLKGGRD